MIALILLTVSVAPIPLEALIAPTALIHMAMLAAVIPLTAPHEETDREEYMDANYDRDNRFGP